MQRSHVIGSLALVLAAVALVGAILGGSLVVPIGPWTPGGPVPGFFVSPGVRLRYSSDWQVAAMSPMLRNGPTRTIGILATGGVHFGCPPYDCWPPTVGPDAAMLELVEVSASGASLRLDASPNTTLGGHAALLEALPDRLTWTIRWPGGLEEFVLTATIRGPDTAAMQQKVLAVLATLRIEPPSTGTR